MGHFTGTTCASNMSHHGGKVAGAGELPYLGKTSKSDGAKNVSLQGIAGKKVSGMKVCIKEA